MLSLGQTVRESVALLRAHPWIGLALGAAIVISFVSVYTGLGALSGAWFVCELYGVQLAASAGMERPRDRSWLGAAAVVLATLIIVAWTGWLAALGFGPDVATADAADEPLPLPEALRRIGLIVGSTALAVGFISPFLYAPLILIERGGRLGGAVVESAWLASRDGALRHLAISASVFLLQFSPALISVILIARTFERAATPFGFAVALPFLAFTIPLGQGILTQRYLAHRALLASPRTVRARPGPPWPLTVLLSTVIVAPVVGLTLVGITAFRPSPLVPGPAPPGDVVVDQAATGELLVPVPDTTLSVQIKGADVSVLAGGEETTGLLPRAGREPIEHVRVVRRRDVYAIEVRQGASRIAHTLVDRAGVRVDDPIRRRLEAHVPLWSLIALLLSFAGSGVVLVRALAPLGAMRAASIDGRIKVRDAHRRATRWGLVLLPLALAALVGGVVSVT